MISINIHIKIHIQQANKPKAYNHIFNQTMFAHYI